MVMSFRIINRASLVAIAARLSTHQAVAFAPAITTTSRSFAFAQSTTPLFSTPPTRYLLTYDYIPDVLEKRGPYREGHIGLAEDMIEEGACVSGGPSGVPGEGVPNGGEC